MDMDVIVFIMRFAYYFYLKGIPVVFSKLEILSSLEVVI